MTQYDLILDWFEKHEYLTVKVALEELGIYALSQRCGELHKRLVPCGLQIKSEMIKVIGRDGKPKHCARYSLIRTNDVAAECKLFYHEDEKIAEEWRIESRMHD